MHARRWKRRRVNALDVGTKRNPGEVSQLRLIGRNSPKYFFRDFVNPQVMQDV